MVTPLKGGDSIPASGGADMGVARKHPGANMAGELADRLLGDSQTLSLFASGSLCHAP
jgi:hypothetical protein